MSGQHTAGPWSVHMSHIYAPDGALLAQVHNPGSKASDYPLEANRDLMAAAPDLLTAVATFVERWDGGDRADTDYVAGLMKAALAKAEGR